MGEQYAERYPQNVGRFVLDSNMDHSQSTTGDFLNSQARGAQAIFGQYVEWCARTAACALHGTDVRALHHELLDRAEQGKLQASDGNGRTITPIEYLSFVNGSSYGPSWYALAKTMRDLRDGTTNQATAQVAKSPRPGSATAPSGAARPSPKPATVDNPFAAVFCSDWTLPIRYFADLQRLRQAQEKVAPDIKMSTLAWNAVLGCLGVGDRVRNPQHSLHVKGANPFLFVQSRYDPATPYEWATAASQQAGQTLLTYDGWGHYVLGKKSPCVSSAVDGYLFTGKLPAAGTHCPAVQPAAPSTPNPSSPPSTGPDAPDLRTESDNELPRPDQPWPAATSWLG